jgi:hypothetical protein
MYLEMLRIKNDNTHYKNEAEFVKARLRIFNHSQEVDQKSVVVQAAARRSRINLNIATLQSIVGREKKITEFNQIKEEADI